MLLACSIAEFDLFLSRVGVFRYGHGVLTFENKTHATWEWKRNVDGRQVSMDKLTVCNTALVNVDCSSF
jgi:Iron/zinc purple acid phosphatase-like protein C